MLFPVEPGRELQSNDLNQQLGERLVNATSTNQTRQPGVARAHLASSAQCKDALSRRVWAAAGDASFQESWRQYSPGGFAIGCEPLRVPVKCLLYARIWKGGNVAITRSLIRGLEGNLMLNKQHLLVNKASLEELEGLRQSSLCRRGAVVFTFVREPLSHFLSGFTEYTFRAWERRQHIDMAFAKATLMTILGGRRPNGSAILHVYPMSGVLAAGWRFDWVGALEHSTSDWEELASFSRSELLHNTKLNSSLGSHPTSSDPQGARAAMAAVLRREPELRGRLCSLLLADFACFGYDIQACRDGRALPPLPPLRAA